MNNCKNCNSPTTNPLYCNRKCSAISNNKKYPRRKKKIRLCVSCNKEHATRNQKCKECISSNLLKEKTIGEYRNMLSVKNKHRSWLHSQVRNLCRSWNPYLRSKPCSKCGYSFHVELCHIKSISSFSDDVGLGIINDESNLLVLCRNCHWEFDHSAKKV